MQRLQAPPAKTPRLPSSVSWTNWMENSLQPTLQVQTWTASRSVVLLPATPRLQHSTVGPRQALTLCARDGMYCWVRPWVLCSCLLCEWGTFVANQQPHTREKEVEGHACCRPATAWYGVCPCAQSWYRALVGFSNKHAGLLALAMLKQGPGNKP